MMKFGTPLSFVNMLLKNIDHTVNETDVLENVIFKWCTLDVNKLAFNNPALVAFFNLHV